MATYRQILINAFKLTIKNPILWFFGLFAAFLGITGEIEILFASVSQDFNRGPIEGFIQGLINGGILSLGFVKGFFVTLVSHPFNLFMGLLSGLILLAFFAILLWISAVSQGSLINAVITKIKGKELSIQKHFNFGTSRIWPILSLNMLLKVILWLLVFVLSGLAVFNIPGLSFFFIVFYILFVSLIIVFSFIIKYAICGVALKDWSFGDSLEFAVKLFKANWILSIELAIILFFFFALSNAIYSYVVFSLFFYVIEALTQSTALLVLLFTGFILLFIIMQTFLITFQWTVWTLVFELITNKKAGMKSLLQKIFRF